MVRRSSPIWKRVEACAIYARVTLIYFSTHDHALHHDPVASRRSLLCRPRLHALFNRSTNGLLETIQHSIAQPGVQVSYRRLHYFSLLIQIPRYGQIHEGSRAPFHGEPSLCDRQNKKERSYVNRCIVLNIFHRRVNAIEFAGSDLFIWKMSACTKKTFESSRGIAPDALGQLDGTSLKIYVRFAQFSSDDDV